MQCRLLYIHEREEHRVKGPSHCSAKKKRTEISLADSAGQGDIEKGKLFSKLNIIYFNLGSFYVV